LSSFCSCTAAPTSLYTLSLHDALPISLAQALDMPGHRLRVVAPDVGGGFGGKGSLYPEEIAVCLAARNLGRPVKWTSDRLEDLTDRKSTRLNSSHVEISYAVFCLKKKK